MNDRDWVACAAALEAFPGDFSPRQAEAYRMLLDGLTREEVLAGLQRYVRTGERWRPGPGEIVALAGRAAVLPPFGVIRQALTLACRTTAVRLARAYVGDAIVQQLVDNPVAAGFVRSVGGERIRRVVLYVPDENVERAWESLARDYAGMAAVLIDCDFADVLGQGDARPTLGTGRGD